MIHTYILRACLLMSGLLTFLYGQSPEELWKMALEENQRLQALRLEYQASLEKASQVSQLPNPEVGIGAFILPVETRLGPQRARVGVTQMFPWFGSLKAKEALANTASREKLEMVTAEGLDIRYALTCSYLELYKAYASQKIIRQNIELLGSIKSLAESKVSSGKATLADVIRLDILMEQLQKDIRLLENSKRNPTTAINHLLQRDLTNPVLVEDSMSFASELMMKDSIMAYIQEEHPVLNIYALQQQASMQASQISQLEGKPSFGLGMDYINTSPRTDAFPLNNGRDALQFRVNVSLPIHRKKFQAKAREEVMRTEAIEIRKAEALSRFAAELEEIYTSYEEARLELASYEQQVKLTQAAVEVLTAAYSGESTGFDDLLEMEAALLEYELAKLGAVVKSQRAKAGIQRYLAF